MSRQPTDLSHQLTRSHREELIELLRDPALAQRHDKPSEEDLSKALRAARALGYCKLFGADWEGLPAQLPAHVAEWAALAYPHQLAGFELAALRLPDEWDREDDPSWRDQLCLERIEQRLDAQAEFVAIADSLEAALENDELPPDRCDELAIQMGNALSRYDRALKRVVGILSTVHESPALAAWRQALNPVYCEETPWWLGPGLEEEAERVGREVDRLLQEVGASPAGEVVCKLVLERCVLSPMEAGHYPQGPFELPRAFLQRPAVQAKGQRVRLLLRWTSPDGAYEAVSSVDFPMEDDETIRITFYDRSTGERASKLRHRRVRFAGVRTRIDEQASCGFRVADLRRSARRYAARLEVVDDADRFKIWPLEQESLERVRKALEQPL